jgi:hypothetical protein
MQVFELYFNPKNETKVSEGFHYKPKDAYEGKLGRIYMIGEIVSPEKKDYSFLQNIFHVARESYYKNTSLTPEIALKETLKEVNDFIKERKYGGRLDIVLFVSKNFAIYLGKIGRTKILLTSNGTLKDIGEELENTGSNLFCNMVSGKMKKSDRLVILTAEIYNFFKKGKLFEEIAKESFGEKTIEKISLLQQEKYADVVGVALIVDHTISLKEKQRKVISKKQKERFSFKKVLFYDPISYLKVKPLKINLKLPSFKKPTIKKNSLLLPLLLLGVIALGSVVIGIENKVRFGKEKEKIALIEEKISSGRSEENFLQMTEALSDLESLLKEKIKYRDEVLFLHNNLEKELLDMSLREELEELELIGEIKEINPDQIIVKNNNLYLFSSTSPLMVVFSKLKKEEVVYPLPTESSIMFSSFSGDKIILFSPSDNLISIENEEVSTSKIDFAFDNQQYVSLSSFLKRPYLLDDQGNIFRYLDNNPLSWIKEKEELVENPVSLTIDGSIFILDKDGKIHRYHEGEKREIIEPFIFPSLSSAQKIYTSPESPIFIIDKKEKRIVIISKDGYLIKQIFNEKLADLKDLSVDGEKIYLLVGKEVYSTSF